MVWSLQCISSSYATIQHEYFKAKVGGGGGGGGLRGIKNACRLVKRGGMGGMGNTLQAWLTLYSNKKTFAYSSKKKEEGGGQRCVDAPSHQTKN